MSTYSDLDRDWYVDLEAQHDEFLRREALDEAERLRESHSPPDSGPVSACSPAADPFLHWPEHDRAQARDRLEALKRASRPPADDGLDFARGMVVAFVLSVPAWALIVFVAWIAGAL